MKENTLRRTFFHSKYCGNEKPSVAQHALNSGHSVKKSSFKLFRHVIDNRLLAVYESLQILFCQR